MRFYSQVQNLRALKKA